MSRSLSLGGVGTPSRTRFRMRCWRRRRGSSPLALFQLGGRGGTGFRCSRFIDRSKITAVRQLCLEIGRWIRAGWGSGVTRVVPLAGAATSPLRY